MDCSKNVDLSRIGLALDYLEKHVFKNHDGIYYVESLLFFLNAETFKESACLGVVVDKQFKEFSKNTKLLFRLLKHLKRIKID